MRQEQTTCVDAIATEILCRECSLEVALAAWQRYHGLRLTDISLMLGRAESTLSAMLNDPERLPRVREDLANLIGYEQEGGGDADDG